MYSFVNIGFGNIINKDMVVGVLLPNISSSKQLIQKARIDKKLIDVSMRRKVKSVIVMENGTIFLCALSTETILLRLKNITKEDSV